MNMIVALGGILVDASDKGLLSDQLHSFWLRDLETSF